MKNDSDLLSGVYDPETAKNNSSLSSWIGGANKLRTDPQNSPDVKKISVFDRLKFAIFNVGPDPLLKKRDELRDNS
jgi:hypothetical protein